MAFLKVFICTLVFPISLFAAPLKERSSNWVENHPSTKEGHHNEVPEYVTCAGPHGEGAVMYTRAMIESTLDRAMQYVARDTQLKKRNYPEAFVPLEASQQGYSSASPSDLMVFPLLNDHHDPGKTRLLFDDFGDFMGVLTLEGMANGDFYSCWETDEYGSPLQAPSPGVPHFSNPSPPVSPSWLPGMQPPLPASGSTTAASENTLPPTPIVVSISSSSTTGRSWNMSTTQAQITDPAPTATADPSLTDSPTAATDPTSAPDSASSTTNADADATTNPSTSYSVGATGPTAVPLSSAMNSSSGTATDFPSSTINPTDLPTSTATDSASSTTDLPNSTTGFPSSTTDSRGITTDSPTSTTDLPTSTTDTATSSTDAATSSTDAATSSTNTATPVTDTLTSTTTSVNPTTEPLVATSTTASPTLAEPSATLLPESSSTTSPTAGSQPSVNLVGGDLGLNPTATPEAASAPDLAIVY